MCRPTPQSIAGPGRRSPRRTTSRWYAYNGRWVGRTLARCSSTGRVSVTWPRPMTTTAPSGSISRGRRPPTASCSRSSPAPTRRPAREGRITRVASTTTTRTTSGAANAGYSQVGEHFNPEVGFLPRRAYRRVEGRYNLSYQPARWPWLRRIAPHVNFRATMNLENELETSQGHWHFLDLRTNSGARFGYLVSTQQDRPREPFTVYEDVTGRQVVIPAGEYSWVTGYSRGIRIRARPSAYRCASTLAVFTTVTTADGIGISAFVSVHDSSRRSAGRGTTSNSRAAASRRTWFRSRSATHSRAGRTCKA